MLCDLAMKLYYWKTKPGNVGDDINPWLFNRLLPNVIVKNSDTTLVAVGTLINDVLVERAAAKKIILFSSGVGYGRQHFAHLPQIDDSWDVYCLRGPLSAQALQVSPDLAITDGALLIRKFIKPEDYRKQYKFSFMPHLWQAKGGDKAWQAVCQQLDIHYIDPRWSVEKVTASIGESEVMLTEAMHGAIFADALRVPWVAVHTSSDVLGFKWLDWCMSINVPYHPEVLPQLKNESEKTTWISPWRKDPNQEAVAALKRVMETVAPQLSQDNHLRSLQTRLEEKLYQLKDNIAAGKYT